MNSCALTCTLMLAAAPLTALAQTTYTEITDGDTLGDTPAAPTLAAPTLLVPPNIFGRVSALAARIKSHPCYTEAIGQDVGIIGVEQSVDPSSMKPSLDLILQTGRPNAGWTKQGMGGVEIWVDRGAGTFSFRAIDAIPAYMRDAPLPTAGTSVVWNYKATCRLNDE